MILCRYGDTNNLFPMGGLAAIDKISIEAVKRYCHRLINFGQRSKLCLFIDIDMFKDLIPIQILPYILVLRCGTLNITNKTRHCSSQLTIGRYCKIFER